MRARQWIRWIAFSAFAFAGCNAAQAAEPTKPIQECVGEYNAREASLHAAGISAANFFHECWWHSRAGQQTKIASNGAAQSNSRVKGDAQADQLQRQATPPKKQERLLAKGSSRHPVRRMARADDLHLKRGVAAADIRQPTWRAARFHDHPKRIVARYVRHPIHLAQVRHLSAKRIALAAMRRPFNHAGHRLALLSQSKAARRERYARRRDQYEEENMNEANAIFAMAPPAYGVVGRRSWIGVETSAGPINRQAVLIGSLRRFAIRGAALHCWDQNVLYLAKGARVSAGLVCEGNSGLNDQPVWFDQYAAR